MLFRSLNIITGSFGPQHPNTVINYSNLAALYRKQEKYQEAEECYREALAIQQAIYGERHPHTITDSCYLADVLMRQGSYGEAKTIYRTVLPVCEKVLGESHETTIAVRDNLRVLGDRPVLP